MNFTLRTRFFMLLMGFMLFCFALNFSADLIHDHILGARAPEEQHEMPVAHVGCQIVCQVDEVLRKVPRAVTLFEHSDVLSGAPQQVVDDAELEIDAVVSS